MPLVGALLWMRRDILARIAAATGMVAAASATRGIGAVAGCRAARCSGGRAADVVLLFEILMLAILGWRMFRALLAPLLFLFFLVPFGAFLVPALQVFTAKFTVLGLQLLGIPVFADGL